ncbi:MAG: leucyl aminopeptidase [Acidimicrobiaceae bacterium]|jgi:leucyl aminopeptidase|nr:leucyl aminopeptidase [Acidimicrobiaceae bacterium]
MSIVSAALNRTDDVEAVAFAVYADLEAASPDLEIDLEQCRRRGFEAKLATTLVLGSAGPSSPIEILVGLGERDRVDREALRRAGAAVARAASHMRSLAIDLTGVVAPGLEVAQVGGAVAEGALLAGYSYDRYRSEAPDGHIARIELVGLEIDDMFRGVARAEVVAEAVALARDLVNTPAADCTPSSFADKAREVAEHEGLVIRVMDEDEIAAERLGGILAVARGSAEPPRLVRLEYVPESSGISGPPPTVVLVGKGITFDSGGLSLKPANGMMTMKTDMSGAAAVLATLAACRRLDVKVRVVGFMAMTENMPGGRATKPGDVLRARNGKTIEVLNTDAEGRLVLADALSLAAEEAPDAIIDLATLTGACVTALGVLIAGLMGNDDRLVAAVGEASRGAGEPSWHLPLPAGYRSHIESEIADMKNIGTPGQAGALSAGLLLEEFVGTTPWVHLDIAGPARSEEDKGYRRKGATGFGVRTLLELLGQYAALGGTVEGRATGTEVLR